MRRIPNSTCIEVHRIPFCGHRCRPEATLRNASQTCLACMTVCPRARYSMRKLRVSTEATLSAWLAIWSLSRSSAALYRSISPFVTPNCCSRRTSCTATCAPNTSKPSVAVYETGCCHFRSPLRHAKLLRPPHHLHCHMRAAGSTPSAACVFGSDHPLTSWPDLQCRFPPPWRRCYLAFHTGWRGQRSRKNLLIILWPRSLICKTHLHK